MTDLLRFAVAAKSDAAALSGFAAQSFCETFGHLYPPRDLQAFLEETYSAAIQAQEIADPQTEHMLAWRAEALVGFVKLGEDRTGHALPGRAALELHRLYVAQAEFGTGTAHALMDWAVERAQARGALDMTLSVFTDNHRAKAFYAKYGFIEIAPYVFRVGGIEDRDLIYRAPLRARMTEL